MSFDDDVSVDVATGAIEAHEDIAHVSVYDATVTSCVHVNADKVILGKVDSLTSLAS